MLEGRRRRRAEAGEDARNRPGLARLLTAVRELDDDLRDGLTGRGPAQAARRLRRLLGADTVLLADLAGPVAVAGPHPEEPEPDTLLAQAYEHGSPVHRPPWSAVPLLVAGELTGGLLVRGGSEPEVTAAAAQVARSLDHAALRRARERIAQAELRTLRAQISPHFLHNALAVIGARIRTDPDRARALLSDFADYLRYSFSPQGDYATVAEELQAIQTYLELQRARFDDRMELTVRMAPEILPVAIPFLVIQPIVENAVRHGLEPKPGPGSIQVSGFGEGPLCVIEVEDDGVGMTPEFAQAVLAGERPADRGHPLGERRRVGLANVDQRLRTVYGPEYGLVIETAPGSGTKVVIRVPRFRRGVVAH
ncbi:sensor histidine kinase [Streptomyces triticirhizae]|uniref:Sensor histidine kinase n=1 Tax=Streptomyces triticirhizae TaxID=2483353 RepID=A0A3M2M8A9_9ACTN|nr:histidine kinase [Streptomyces triticirhizae]RMI45857.1 sensor histidine kinase [Streptomyces triticirhizae]